MTGFITELRRTGNGLVVRVSVIGTLGCALAVSPLC